MAEYRYKSNKHPETSRFSDALKVPERELLERFLLDTGHGVVNPIDAHGIIGHAIDSVATEHERSGAAALYQPGQDYTSRELVDMIAQTIFKPKFYEAFKERLDAAPEKTSHRERLAQQRASETVNAQTR